ncbi:LysM peptidoglycan-binding domain-containing protein [Halalkalibacter krulwichiae]|uniref:Gamma-D-glutamyl-L-diamino acid endopeptidase 1 n=1 Tax=Halalkalibacter krulwichiae TaxID=199441 RepID=A0A1X9MEU0_9BACI|nr:LysM domain-containing protein [Halalkalibacter krulwichiae]ARK28952.1 Gamma-D-glutamyl-L-diamino acid endopeptidase 1 [Halalkalibacter krulwichiae]
MKIYARTGDSLWYYSQIFSLPLQLVFDANNSVTPTKLQTGMIVEIPCYKLDHYQLKEGDTLWGISRSFQMPLDRLILVNQSVNPIKLSVGDCILIPTRLSELHSSNNPITK